MSVTVSHLTIEQRRKSAARHGFTIDESFDRKRIRWAYRDLRREFNRLQTRILIASLMSVGQWATLGRDAVAPAEVAA